MKDEASNSTPDEEQTINAAEPRCLPPATAMVTATMTTTEMEESEVLAAVAMRG
ncbi:hypothetical protein SLEP1_g10836 [Rubroshorea leprosula]|uniref:Uncharacterized protein n=1 Tax=Rubroshorea leprosula TaxID=152421 RepID=A0AAV5I9C0_9ROSI|nr:hypothetical protein SLEP1_g10836 [Rubroshorea leprosula]